MPHGVDLRARVGHGQGKEVSRRDRVGTIRLGMNTQDLSFKTVGVGGASLVVPTASTRTLVGVCSLIIASVVSDGDIQIAGGIPGHSTTCMTAGLALGGKFEHHDLGIGDQRIIEDLPPADHRLGINRIVVVEIHPTVLLKIGIKGHPCQTLFIVAGGVDIQLTDGFDTGVHGIKKLHGTTSFDDEHSAVLQHLKRHGLIERAFRHHNGCETIVVRFQEGVGLKSIGIGSLKTNQ
jgi:hypothetical protein